MTINISNDPLDTTDSVVMECVLCETEVVVLVDTRQFYEVNEGPRMAHYSAKLKLAGVSRGKAETFECLKCHATIWAQRHTPGVLDVQG